MSEDLTSFLIGYSVYIVAIGAFVGYFGFAYLRSLRRRNNQFRREVLKYAEKLKDFEDPNLQWGNARDLLLREGKERLASAVEEILKDEGVLK